MPAPSRAFRKVRTVSTHGGYSSGKLAVARSTSEDARDYFSFLQFHIFSRKHLNSTPPSGNVGWSPVTQPVTRTVGSIIV
jgi:hypothetical protein